MLTYPLNITLCGFGGQGIILSAVMLGTTAVTKSGLYAVQTQSYGSEARGGQCQAALIIDQKPINSPVAESCNLLIAMFQTAYDKYIDTLDEDGILVIDPALVTELHRPIPHTLSVPATSIAVSLGNRMAANMVMLGFLSEALGVVPKSDLLETVASNVNPKFVELNRSAIEQGADYARVHGLRPDA